VAERVSFPSTLGPRLAGLIDHPEGPSRGWGVFSHGFTLGKDCPAASRICKQLASEGVGMPSAEMLAAANANDNALEGRKFLGADMFHIIAFAQTGGFVLFCMKGHHILATA